MEAASVHKSVRTCRARSGLAACGSSSRSSSLSLAYAPNASISAQHLRADRVWRSAVCPPRIIWRAPWHRKRALLAPCWHPPAIAQSTRLAVAPMVRIAHIGLGVAAAAAVLAYELMRRRRGKQERAAKWIEKEQCWQVSGYDHVCGLLRSPHVCANFLPSFLAQLPSSVSEERFAFLADFFSRWPLFQDGARQRRTHAVLARLFSPDRMRRLEVVIRDEINALLLPLEQCGGDWDAVADFAKPLPLRVIIRALGFSKADEHDLKQWADTVEDWFGGQGDVLDRFERCQCALRAFEQRAERLIESLHTGPVPDSPCIAEELLAACGSGNMQRADLVPNLFFLMSAGHETSASFISNALLLSLDLPFLFQRLRCAQPGELDDMITEMLRLITPVTRAYREVESDFTYEGIDFKRGQQIQLHLADANRDGSVFPAPETFRLQRSTTNRHLAFGFRDHLCPVMKCGNVGAGGGKVTLCRLRSMFAARVKSASRDVTSGPFEQRAGSRSLTS